MTAVGLVEDAESAPGQGQATGASFFATPMLSYCGRCRCSGTQSDQTRRPCYGALVPERAAGHLSLDYLRPPPEETQRGRAPALWQYTLHLCPRQSEYQNCTMRKRATRSRCGVPGKAGRAPADAPHERRQPIEHRLGLSAKITGVQRRLSSIEETSITYAMTRGRRDSVRSNTGPEHLLELEFDGGPPGKAHGFPAGMAAGIF